MGHSPPVIEKAGFLARGVGFEALDAGAHSYGGAGVRPGFVIAEGDGFEMVGPNCEGEGAG